MKKQAKRRSSTPNGGKRARFSKRLSAQETPSWIRRNAISPDGQTLAFSYKGDIWTVPVTGGEARQLTSNKAY